MDWLKRLQDLLKIKIEGKADLRKFFNKWFSVNTTNTTVHHHYHFHIQCDTAGKLLGQEDTKNQKIINASKLSPKERKQLAPILREAIECDDFLLLEDNSQKTLEDIQKYQSTEDSAKILGHLREIAKPSDIPIFQAALYLKYVYENKGANVQQLKDQIIRAYGNRGSKIANITSAGYVESLLIPLYQQMKSGTNFSREKFAAQYEVIINESAFSVFVNFAMSEVGIRRRIAEQILTNKKYGQDYVNLHGIGSKNLQSIAKAIKELTDEYPSIKVATKEKIGNTIFVKIRTESSIADLEQIFKQS